MWYPETFGDLTDFEPNNLWRLLVDGTRDRLFSTYMHETEATTMRR